MIDQATRDRILTCSETTVRRANDYLVGRPSTVARDLLQHQIRADLHRAGLPDDAIVVSIDVHEPERLQIDLAEKYREPSLTIVEGRPVTIPSEPRAFASSRPGPPDRKTEHHVARVVARYVLEHVVELCVAVVFAIVLAWVGYRQYVDYAERAAWERYRTEHLCRPTASRVEPNWAGSHTVTITTYYCDDGTTFEREGSAWRYTR